MIRRVLFVLALMPIIAAWIACGGGNSTTKVNTSQLATTNISISDPATCSASASGPYAHVYVTITDVQINASSTAGDNDPSWIDLTPNLKSAPQQVDLLGVANSQCFLASLGSTTALQPGTYQQIRIMLANNTGNVSLSANNCKNAGVNCVVLAADPNNPQMLQLSSESTTGLKIPSGQIAGGGFTIAAGQTKDLNIDFDTCASIVVQGNGQYRLKPVLHAGEVNLTSTSINGKLIDKATGQAITGGKAIVALEQKDTNGIDRVIMQTTPDATGAFNFCPVPAGTYDVVAVAVNGSNVAYATTITMGVQPGNALGNVQMIAVSTGTGGTTTSTAPATITGTVSSANASSGGTVIDASLSALQQVQSGSTTLTFTIPVGAQSATLAVTTAKPASCTSTTCPAYTADYTMTVPPANPTVGTFAASGTTYTAGAAGTGTYQVEALAFVPQSGGTSDCNPNKITTAAISVTGGASTTAPAISFVGCQ